MTSHQGSTPSKMKTGVNLDAILKELGLRGRYLVTQVMLVIFASFLYPIPIMDTVFTGYEPDHQCSHVDNVTQLEPYLPDDVTSFTLHDVRYRQCSIDVTINSSGTSFTHSLPCVAGVNFSMPSDTSFLTEWSLVCDKKGLAKLIQTGVFGGQVAGYLTSSALADRFGRKKVYVSAQLCLTVTLVVLTLVPSYYLFLTCKTIAGFFMVAMVQPAYTMFMELLPRDHRFMSSVVDCVLWNGAGVFLALTAYSLQGWSWRVLSLAFSALFLHCLLLPWFLDESLRWLLATGEIDEAERILKKACRINGKDFAKMQAMLHKQTFVHNMTTNGMLDHDATNSINEEECNKTEVTEKPTSNDLLKRTRSNSENMVDDDGKAERETLNNETDVLWRGGDADDTRCESSLPDSLKPQEEVFSAKYTVLDLFRHRAVFVPFLVVVFVWMTSNLYYYVTMLGSAKLSGNRFLNFIFLHLMDYPSVLVCLCLMRRFNRRPLAFVYGILVASFLLISVGLATLGGGEEVTLTLATVAQYLGMSALGGSNIMLFVYYMEVFPTAMRAVGAGTAGMIIKMTDMASPFLLLWAEKTPWAPGVLLGCLCCLASLSIWLLPETRHRKLPDTIEEIEAWKRKETVTPRDVELIVHVSENC